VLNTEEIKNYLVDLAKDIPDPYKKQFVKSAFTDITNNANYHTPVKELPDNAPAWAEKAMSAGDLVNASVNNEQKELLTQIIHWLADIIAKSQSTDTTETAVADKRDAVKQLQSLNRMKLEDMLRHERSWFSRQKNLIKGDISGMEKVADVGNGYAWFLLVSQDAFNREGKALQNCIGSNYTAQNCQASNTQIYILKNKALESVVAMRIENNVMQEVKGHNNRPPVAAYIPYVNKFIQLKHIQVGAGAERDLIGSGYAWNRKTQTITHISEAYPYEWGPELSNNMILGKWTASGENYLAGFTGNLSIPEYVHREGTRWDLVSKRNTYHPQRTFLISYGEILAIGNLPNPDRAISQRGMETMASQLKEVCRALNVVISPKLIGSLKRPGLNRFGITVDNGEIKTDYELLADVSVINNPASIATIPEPSERLQKVAVTENPNTLLMIQNPSEATQILAMTQSKTVHKLMNEFVAARNGETPSEIVQLAAVENDGTAIQTLVDASEAVELAAVENDGDAIIYIAYNHRKQKKPGPRTEIQNAAVTRSPSALGYLFRYRIPVENSTKVLAIESHRDDSYALKLIQDDLEEYNQMTPELEQLLKS